MQYNLPAMFMQGSLAILTDTYVASWVARLLRTFVEQPYLCRASTYEAALHSRL